ncbi:sensor histidine kinase [Microtetraspora malaysiensis]|uniref:sensor histidine kinase n=1 Tax=Microtetraspora malaysiensis TaxID=161358 RepID=UPI003D8CAD06
MTDRRQAHLIGDGVLALVLTVFAQLDLRFNIEQADHYGSEPVRAITTAVATAVLVLRRRAPVATAVCVALASAGPQLFTTLTVQLWGDFLPLLIATYSAARYAEGRRVILGVLAPASAMAVAWLLVPSVHSTPNLPIMFLPYLFCIAAGRIVRRQVHGHEAAWALARRLEDERQESIRVAISEERGRLARELHDIVAHCVSVMVVQAGAAEDLLDRDPEAARAPLRSVQDTGRQAITELSRMLGLLRGAAGGPGLRPQPGTADLADLATHMSEIGLPVTVSATGAVRPLAPGVELTVYRVVQEALTNTLKHAGPTQARVLLHYAENEVIVEVLDDGHGATGAGTGHGLVGMRERVGLYGGTLSAAPEPAGGFAVRATLPLTEPPARAGAAPQP